MVQIVIGHVHRAAHGRRSYQLDRGFVDAPVGEPGERLFQHDPAFEAGQARTEAEVDAVSERDVTVERALDVEAVGVGDTRVRRAPRSR